jgi:hypothetical protein
MNKPTRQPLRLIDSLRLALADADTKEVLGILSLCILVFSFFFWLALGFDQMASGNPMIGKCQSVDNRKASILFATPLAIALSGLAALGEILNEIEEKRKWKVPYRMLALAKSVGAWIVIFGVTTLLLIAWC